MSGPRDRLVVVPMIGPAEHVCDPERLVVVMDDGYPDHEVCPVCQREFW